MPTDIDQSPLSESTFYILLSLAPGPQHGYAMLKDVESLSGGRLRLSTGTLYGAIQRLLEQGWIEPVESEDAEPTGRPRKAYRLTGLGQRIAEAETERLKGLVSVARRRIARSQP
jgi:DNA-binding PadR family transcriptional regulator